MPLFKRKKSTEPTLEISGPSGFSSGATLHGSNTQFQSDPGAYFKQHACILAAEPIETSGNATGATRKGMYTVQSVTTFSNLNISTNSVQVGAEIYNYAAAPYMAEVKLSDSAGGPTFNWLPYTPDKLEAVGMDPGADYFITGPLTGCNVYIATKANMPPMAFHANANTTAGITHKRLDIFRFKKTLQARAKVENIAFKDAEADRVASHYGYTIQAALKWGEYEIPAFVWGKRYGQVWKVYVHEVNQATKSFTNKQLAKV